MNTHQTEEGRMRDPSNFASRNFLGAIFTRKRAWAQHIAIIAGIGLAVIGFSLMAMSEEEPATSSRPSARAGAKAAGSSSPSAKDALIERKLDQILAGQQAILQKFDAIMEELRIIKVRTTIRSGSS